jgi:multicomponent Na+:H+ antiporter subunit F
MFDSTQLTFMAALLVCCALCLYRIARGPTAPDRMVAIDVLGTLVVGFIAIITAVTGREYILTLAIVWALVSFIGTLALAKYLTGKAYNE